MDSENIQQEQIQQDTETAVEVKINPNLEQLAADVEKSTQAFKQAEIDIKQNANSVDPLEAMSQRSMEESNKPSKQKFYTEEDYMKLMAERDSYKKMAITATERIGEMAEKMSAIKKAQEQVVTKTELQKYQEKFEQNLLKTQKTLDMLTNNHPEPRYVLPQRKAQEVQKPPVRMYYDTKSGKMRPVPN